MNRTLYRYLIQMSGQSPADQAGKYPINGFCAKSMHRNAMTYGNTDSGITSSNGSTRSSTESQSIATMIAELSEAIDALHESSPGRDFLLISAGISRKLHHELSVLIADNQQHEKCTIFLTTRGGDPDAGFRIARCLQHHYKHIRLVIPSRCKSAGTLIAIGAHELAIGNLGELGPLDIQVLKASELQERSSGLDIIQALEAVETHTRVAFRKTLMDIRQGGRLSTKLAGEFAASLATGIAAPLYSQIDPNRLGEMQRAMRIAHEYGHRLDRSSQSLYQGALENLIGAYPSHRFVIDRKEAGELFKHVRHPSKEESRICLILWGLLGEESGQLPIFVRNEPEKHSGGQHDDTIENGTAEPAPTEPEEGSADTRTSDGEGE